MEAFDIEVDSEDLDRWRVEVQQLMDESKKGVYSKAVNSPLIQDLVAGKVEPVVAPAVLITDSPKKLQGAVGDRELATLAEEIGKRFRAAETEIIIITPYFVPGKAGVETITELIDKGTRVVVVTNSLASTNHVPVHSGYARYRKPLLEAGTEIFEIKADAVSVPEDSEVNPEILTLHSKATIIDRSTVFIGSLNFDPRSIDINTEMGLFIESEVAGEGLFQAVRDSLGEATYKVVLDDKGKLNWIHLAGTENEEVLTKEPLTSFGRRFSAGFYGILPIESQL